MLGLCASPYALSMFVAKRGPSSHPLPSNPSCPQNQAPQQLPDDNERRQTMIRCVWRSPELAGPACPTNVAYASLTLPSTLKPKCPTHTLCLLRHNLRTQGLYCSCSPAPGCCSAF